MTTQGPNLTDKRTAAMVRRLLRRAGRDRVLIRRLPATLGGAKCMASAEGGLRALSPRLKSVDRVMADFASAFVFRGANVWDVGANLGLFASMAAGLAGHDGSVLCLEPDPWLAQRLVSLAAINGAGGFAPTSVLTAAAADEWSIADLNVAVNARAANYLEGFGSTMTGGVRYRVPTVTVALDSLVAEFGPPDILKIDVEGAEEVALAGAKEILASVNPVCLLELRPQFSNVTKDLEANGYQLYDAAASNLLRHRFVRSEGVPYHALAIPTSRL